MIIKSLIIASMFLNLLGLHGPADKFDAGVIRDRSNPRKEVIASNSSLSLPDILPRPKIKPMAPKASANARHYILADPASGTIFAKNDADARVPIASTTKIMSAVIALENYQLDDVATISSEASTQVGADAFLLANEKITIESLLNCMLIKSGNDSAYAIAEHMNNSDEEGITKFINKMNEKAKELGMNNTDYHDPAGLDVTGYSSAHDLYLVTKYALKFPKIREIVKKDRFSVKNIDSTIWHDLKNSNRLVAEYHYPGAIGVKTGFMPEAGHVLVGAAERDGHTLISIVINTYADTPSASADESKRLLDWGFSNIIWE
ncbi:MAG: D-alanyl-D-alanine carboxypeptidase [Patescibacteria group bacterium]|nr:D-alanyl-D-alanine carboxypeptidase [Patescibacteria group bacterium]